MSEHTRPPIERMLWFDRQVRDERYPNARDLAERFEISQRTAYRDIDFMRTRMGAPIEYDAGRRGYFYTATDFHLPTFALTEGELSAAFIAGKVMDEFSNTPYATQLRTALRKITGLLPDTISIDLSALGDSISFDMGAKRHIDIETYQVVSDAMQRRLRLRIRYYTASRDTVSTREVDPYHLYNHLGDWYLVAYDHLRGEIRDFAFNRIRRAEQTSIHFSILDGFDAATHLGQAFGVEKGNTPEVVVIRFDAYQSRWIRERVWHDTQTITEHDDGGLTLRFEAVGLEEVQRWVL
ncbi:MAG: WYL domain-containing protein, partial [Candidatus Poribacteria bacterium]|nr:WYL domain-containing protein [Candidatus Poribacteria bacterium]